MAATWLSAGPAVYSSGTAWPSSLTIPATAKPPGVANGDTVLIVIMAYHVNSNTNVLRGWHLTPESDGSRVNTWQAPVGVGPVNFPFAQYTPNDIGGLPPNSRTSLWSYWNTWPTSPPYTLGDDFSLPALPVTIAPFQSNGFPYTTYTPNISGWYRAQVFAIRPRLSPFETAKYSGAGPTNFGNTSILVSGSDDFKLSHQYLDYYPGGSDSDVIGLTFASAPDGGTISTSGGSVDLRGWTVRNNQAPITGRGGSLVALSIGMTADRQPPKLDISSGSVGVGLGSQWAPDIREPLEPWPTGGRRRHASVGFLGS